MVTYVDLSMISGRSGSSVIAGGKGTSCLSSSSTSTVCSVVDDVRGESVVFVVLIKSCCQTGTTRGVIRDLELEVLRSEDFVFTTAVEVTRAT